MQSVKTLIAILCLMAGCFAATTVTISEPAATTTTSPMQVSASVNATGQVLQLYIDGAKVSETTASALSDSVSLAAGSHRVTVQAVSSSNQITKTFKDVTITSSAPPPPPGLTRFYNLQESTDWTTCGTCGNQKGTTGEASYNMVRGLTAPAIDGSATSAEFSIGGSNPYTNGYWYLSNTPAKTPLKILVYDFYVYVPEASATAPQAIEFECQHTVNGYTYNYAWQADYASHSWRTFDFINRVWVSSVIPFAGFTPGTWHHITAQYHASGTYTVHAALTVDGAKTVVNIVHPAKYTGQTWDSFTNAFQLDLNGKPTAFQVYIDKMTVEYE